MSAIVIDDLMKRVGKQRVFSNLNLEVLEGEFFTLLGLRDSGKTTLTRILMGYLKANRGSASIYDMDCTKDSKEIKESVSYVPQEILLQDNLRANSIFKKTLSAHNLRSTEDIDFLCDYFSFDPRLKIADMDDNERKVFSIINALIVKPRLLILDEPLKGLHLENRKKLFDHLKQLNRSEKMTIFMLTDSLIDAKKYAKRIAYLHQGVIKNVEYVNEKPANDKILRINNYRGNLNPFTSIGGHLIKDDPDETVLYYDQNLIDLSKAIYEERLESYSLENAQLEDKINAYYSDKETYVTKEDLHKGSTPPVADTIEATEINGVRVEEDTPYSQQSDQEKQETNPIATPPIIEEEVIDTKATEDSVAAKPDETEDFQATSTSYHDTKVMDNKVTDNIEEKEEDIL